MKLRDELSDAEKSMFYTLNTEELMDALDANNVMSFYDIVALRCFRDDIRGPAVDALRRAVFALQKSNLYRCTPEFDKLISF
jgi:hypothetical protein